MPYQDFTSYTEVDEDGDITISRFRCDVATMRRDANSYVYRDMGVGHFVAFEHRVTIHIGAASNTTAHVGLWGVSNGAHTIQDKVSANVGVALSIYVSAGPTYTIQIKDWDTDGADSYNAVVNTTYYFTIERDGTAMTCRIYSDVQRQTLLDTLVIACAATRYRYIETVQSRDDAGVDAITLSCYVENLDLHPAASYGYVMM